MRTIMPGRPSARKTRSEPVDLAALLGLQPGQGTLARVLQVRSGPLGQPAGRLAPLLLVEGAVLGSVRVGVREGAELLGPGDLLLPDRSGPGLFQTSLRALTACRFAVLDERVLAIAAERQALASALFEAAGKRTAAIAAQVVITQQTSIDERLRILLPALAARWGVVTPDGVVLPAFLSHAVLAAMIGVRRPSLTSALGGLLESALLVRLPDRRWRVATQLGMLS